MGNTILGVGTIIRLVVQDNGVRRAGLFNNNRTAVNEASSRG